MAKVKEVDWPSNQKRQCLLTGYSSMASVSNKTVCQEIQKRRPTAEPQPKPGKQELHSNPCPIIYQIIDYIQVFGPVWHVLVVLATAQLWPVPPSTWLFGGPQSASVRPTRLFKARENAWRRRKQHPWCTGVAALPPVSTGPRKAHSLTPKHDRYELILTPSFCEWHVRNI